MKKIIILVVVLSTLTMIVVSTIYYIYINNLAVSNNTKKQNEKFEYYYKKEIMGTELITVFNKATQSNEDNVVEKDKNGKYIDNSTNSINIDIKFIDEDVTYNFKTIINNGTEQFISYYREIIFKCTEISYHEQTKNVKYMLFEQITE